MGDGHDLLGRHRLHEVGGGAAGDGRREAVDVGVVGEDDDGNAGEGAGAQVGELATRSSREAGLPRITIWGDDVGHGEEFRLGARRHLEPAPHEDAPSEARSGESWPTTSVYW